MAIRDLTARIRITADTRGVQKGLKESERSVVSFRTAFLRASVAIGAAVATVVAAFNTFRNAVDLGAQEQALSAQLGRAGISIADFVDDLKEASQQALSTNQIIASSTQAILLGINPEDISKLLETAAARAVATGRTVEQAFQDITTGIGRQSRLILDNLGFVIDLQEAHDVYAKQLGKTSEALTEVEKKQALTNAVIRDGADALEDFGKAVTEKANIQRLGALVTDAFNNISFAFKNFVNEQEGVGRVLGTIVEALERGNKAFREARLEQLAAVESAKKLATAQKRLAKEQKLVADFTLEFQEQLNLTFGEAIPLAIRAVDLLTAAEKRLREETGILESVFEKLGIRTLGSVQSELAEVTIAIEAQRFKIAEHGDTTGFFSRQLEILIKRETELKEALGETIPEIEILVEQTQLAAETTETLAQKSDRAALALSRERLQVQGLNEDLGRLNETGVITATTFDRIAATQGEAAAVQAALASGATTFGRRINLRGGSRLVNVSLINNRAGVAPVGGNFGTSRQQSRFFPNLTTIT